MGGQGQGASHHLSPQKARFQRKGAVSAARCQRRHRGEPQGFRIELEGSSGAVPAQCAGDRGERCLPRSSLLGTDKNGTPLSRTSAASAERLRGDVAAVVNALAEGNAPFFLATNKPVEALLDPYLGEEVRTGLTAICAAATPMRTAWRVRCSVASSHRRRRWRTWPVRYGPMTRNRWCCPANTGRPPVASACGMAVPSRSRWTFTPPPMSSECWNCTGSARTSRRSTACG